MGPNGQAQYLAPDLAGATDVLFRHYDHAYLMPGERYPQPAPSTDLRRRNVYASPQEIAGSAAARQAGRLLADRIAAA